MKTLLFLSVLTSSFTYGRTNPVVKQTYSNLIITTSALDYVEEMNKTFIIGQYAEILAKKHSYNDKIYLYFFEEQIEAPSIKAWLPKLTDNSDNVDGLNIMFTMPQYDIEGCLKVIENAILNKTKLKRFVDKHQVIYATQPSTIIKEILATRINRPNVIKELERPVNFSYYIQNNRYHFISTQDKIEKELEIFDYILDYQILPKDIAVIFTKKDELKIIRPKSPLVTEHIDKVPEYYWTYKVKLLGGNKISIEFSQLSESKNRVMLYLLDRNIFIQDLDKVLGKQ